MTSHLKTPLVDDFASHQLAFPTPDWFNLWTIPKAHQELTNFKFMGEGWYVDGNDTMLVLKNDESRYWFYVWNDSDPRKPMVHLTTLPEFK